MREKPSFSSQNTKNCDLFMIFCATFFLPLNCFIKFAVEKITIRNITNTKYFNL
jgi:hypothetical protein